MINVYFHIRNQYYHTLIAFRRPIQMKRKRGDQFVWPDFHNILVGSHLWRRVPDHGRRPRSPHSNIHPFLLGSGQQAQGPELHYHPGMLMEFKPLDYFAIFGIWRFPLSQFNSYLSHSAWMDWPDIWFTNWNLVYCTLSLWGIGQ